MSVYSLKVATTNKTFFASNNEESTNDKGVCANKGLPDYAKAISTPNANSSTTTASVAAPKKNVVTSQTDLATPNTPPAPTNKNAQRLDLSVFFKPPINKMSNDAVDPAKLTGIKRMNALRDTLARLEKNKSVSPDRVSSPGSTGKCDPSHEPKGQTPPRTEKLEIATKESAVLMDVDFNVEPKHPSTQAEIKMDIGEE